LFFSTTGEEFPFVLDIVRLPACQLQEHLSCLLDQGGMSATTGH